MNRLRRCGSGALDNLGRPIRHPPSMHTGVCADWHLWQDELAEAVRAGWSVPDYAAWELAAYWEGVREMLREGRRQEQQEEPVLWP